MNYQPANDEPVEDGFVWGDVAPGLQSDEGSGNGLDEGPQLFEGDRGELTFSQRKTLVVILKRKYLAADKYPKEWATLLESRVAIETRLNDLFQVLVVDEDRQFAYKRSAATSDGGIKFPSLLHNRQYTLEETVLLVELRDKYAREWASGASSVYVDHEEMLNHLESYRRANGTNHVATRRREAGSIEGLVDEGILICIDGDTDRFRIAPVINAVLTIEKLRELKQWIISDDDGGPEA